MSTNFDFIKFCAEAKILDIICYQIFVAVNKKIEKYYISIYQVYDIIQAETRGIISKNIIL